MRAAFSLFRYQLRYWRRHRLQAFLSLTGIVLGVAVFSAIRMANEGALAAFSEGVEAFAGRATHRVFSPAGAQVPDEVFQRLVAHPGVIAATPYLEDSLRVEETPADGSFAVTVLGIDPFSGEPFHTFRFSGAGEAENSSAGTSGLIEEFLSEPGAVILSAPLARRLGLSPGATFRGLILGQSRSLRVVGVFRPSPGSGEAFTGVALADVSTHQELFGKLGGVDAITLILREGGEAPVSAALPEGLALERIGKRSERIAVMAEAFQLNLEAMGLFALLVAGFLVFNAATFSVVQRRREIAIVRCIGAPAEAVLGSLLLEALVLGVVAGILGVALGRMLAGIMLSQTQATLFEVILLTKAEFIVSLGGWKIWVIGILLGVITSLLGAWWPAREAKGVSPVFALSAARGAPARGQGWRPAAAGGMLLLLLAAVLVLPEWGGLIAALVGAMALALGGALLCPLGLTLMARLSAPLLGRAIGPAGRMAGRNLQRSNSRTAVATAALMVALALALSIEITVRSFRQTFDLWITQTLHADIYLDSHRGRAGFPEKLAAWLRAQPWVKESAELRQRRITMGDREVLLLGVQMFSFARAFPAPHWRTDRDSALAGVREGQVAISETLAYPLGLKVGDTLTLPTLAGPRQVTIAGIVQNYALPAGMIYLERSHYARLFGEESPRGIAVWLTSEANAEEAVNAIRAHPESGALQVSRNSAVREEAMRVFDRSFQITDFMASLAAVIAFIAVVSALMALLEERTRLLGYLRAVGFSRRMLGLSLSLEAGLIALTAALLSWGTGLLMSMVLIFVVNRRAFGWTLQFHPGAGSYLGLLGLALVAALLGSIYPIYRATRLSITATIREE